ncbi:MAG: HAMP domain-containing histidine kinase [Lachnospiraceae bacterium]|nr:HAMP domain-containing histidine kinase [Lachnospiraceae bacterium]
MQDLFFWAFFIALMIAIGEFLYILSLRNNIRNIARDFSEKLSMDTNTTVSVSIADPEIRRLALLINRELKALRKERLKLQQGDQELKNAVTNIAHDIRTPLAAISGYLELMETVPTDENGARYLAVIRERTEALKRLTEELFQYSIITYASDDINPTQLSLKSELEIALTGAYGMLSQRGIVPEIHMPEADVKRVLDHTALQRVFSNILVNTAKYSDGDLTVVLTESGELLFRNRASGLSQVEADRLFDRFYTVENAKGSTGLGLSIAKQLTEKMGGSIQAEWQNGNLSIRLLWEEK